MGKQHGDHYYKILGIEPGVLPEEVKQAYRDLVMVWHPDRFPDNPRLQQKAQEKLKEINEAYEKLKSYHPETQTRTPQTATPPTSSTPSPEMVLIPVGEFLMGDAFNEGKTDERPLHRVSLDAFYIDQYEVTNAQYQAFCDATGRSYPPDPGFGGDSTSDYFRNKPNYPVVNVTWEDATAYAQWAGKRLPTEAEWEKAARGGLEGKRYPWGDGITHDNANYSGTGGRDQWTYTSPVGSFPPNGYGLYDMAGNVWEWCADWYDGNYYSSSPIRNTTDSATGSYRVVRGGSWDDDPSLVRVAYRDRYGPADRDGGNGVRCAKSLTH